MGLFPGLVKEGYARNTLQEECHEQSPFLQNGIIWDKNLLSLGKDGLVEEDKAQKCVSNGIVFARDEVNIRVVLLNIVKPENDMIRSGDVSGNVEVG